MFTGLKYLTTELQVFEQSNASSESVQVGNFLSSWLSVNFSYKFVQHGVAILLTWL